MGVFGKQPSSAGSAGAWNEQEQCGGGSGEGVLSLPAPREPRAHSQALEHLRGAPDPEFIRAAKV